MDLDDLDIYGDLDTFQKEEEKKTGELLSLEAKYNDSLKTIETLQVENAHLKKQIRKIEVSFQSLLDTAKAEIKRKDKQIEQLRKEKDDICFRRKHPRREYIDEASTSQYSNVWFNNESVLPAHDFGTNANTNKERSKETIGTIDPEQQQHPCATSFTSSNHENTQIRDEYKNNNHRDERYERKYDFDPQRGNYHRSNSQKDQQESRYRRRSSERDGSSGRWAPRDYSRSYDIRAADRSRRDERDIKNKPYKSEKEEECYNNTESSRRQHYYDRLADRLKYLGKEEKTKSDRYDGLHDRRSDIKKHREDTNKKCKEMNEKVCEKVTNINKNEVVTFAKSSDARPKTDVKREKSSKSSERNLDARTKSDDVRGNPSKSSERNLEDRTKSDDVHGKPSKSSESRNENKSNENHKLNEGSHKDRNRNENLKVNAFLGKNLPASKDSKLLEKNLAEEKLINEKLLGLKSEFPSKKNDKNANRLTAADGMTTPKKTTLLDELFGRTPTNEGDVNSNILSNTIEILKGSNCSATTHISNHTETSESSAISPEIILKDTKSVLTVEAKTEEFIASNKSENQTADDCSSTDFDTSVKANEETLDYAKIATIILSDEKDQTGIERKVGIASVCEKETVCNETKMDGNKEKGGIQILENIRLPNIYEIRAHQRRLRESAAAKKAKRDLTAKTKDIKQNTTQNTDKTTAPFSEDFSKDPQKNSTTLAESNKDVGLQEGNVETKTIRDECTFGNTTQINAGISADSNTNNNKESVEESSSETTHTDDQQSIESEKLLDKNVTSTLAVAAKVGIAEEAVNSNNIVDDSAWKQTKPDDKCTNHQNEIEESIMSNNDEKFKEILVAEKIDDIELKQKSKVFCQKNIDETVSNAVNINTSGTVEIAAEEANSLNEAKSEPASIITNIKSAVSRTLDRLLESPNTGNESMAEAQVVSEKPNRKSNRVLSKDKREEKYHNSHDVVSEQNFVEQSEVKVVEQKAVAKSAVHKSEKLLQSTYNTNKGSSVIENCITKSSEIVVVVSDPTMSIVNDPVRSECSIELLNGSNTAINKTDLSVIAENGTNTNAVAIEECESTNRSDICAETKTVKGNDSELRETEVTVLYVINNMDKPTNSYLEKNETITEVQDVSNTESNSMAESKKVEIHPKTVKNLASTSHRSENLKNKPKELSNTVNSSAERNEIVENLNRAEVLWKFKIPKLSAKRKREESVDGTSSKECDNTGTDAIKRERLYNKAEAPINSPKQKKSAKLIPKQMQEETKVLEINVNMEKNLLETKTLFEDQKKSERIIKEIDNWARRKVGEPTDVVETEIQIDPTQAHKKSSSKHETLCNVHSKVVTLTDFKVLNTHIKQKTDKHKAHRDKNCESSSNNSKCYSENQQEHKKSPKDGQSPNNKADQANMKGQNPRIQERRKSFPKVEHEDCTLGSKPQNAKCDMEIHTENSQMNGEKNAKGEQTLITKAQQGELQTQEVESIEYKRNSERKELESWQGKSIKCSHTDIEKNNVKKSRESRELGNKTKKSFHANIEKKNTTVKKEEKEQSREREDMENITAKSQVEATSSSKIANVSDFGKEPTHNLNQKSESDTNIFAAKTKTIEKGEKHSGNHENRAKSEVGVDNRENVQKVTGTEVSSAKPTQVATSTFGSLKDIIIANGSNTETTKDNQRNAATFSQTPKRRRTVADTEQSASSDDSDVISKPRKRKCQMRVEDSDCEVVARTPPTIMSDPPALHDVKHVDSERKYKDIIDILQNDTANESNDNLSAPQTPTSLPVNISQDAAYEEIDSRLKLMFTSPKAADKTATTSSLLADHRVKAQQQQSPLQDNAVERCVTGTDAPLEIGVPGTKAPVGDAKPPADFNVTDSFLSDISTNSFHACDMNGTINETNYSGVNATSSFSDNNVSTKRISLGSSDYRFEKVSENVVNLFITRKRRSKRKSTATITTNTVSAS